MRYLTILVLLIFSITASAQVPNDRAISPEILDQAEQLADAYDDELSLTSKQFLLVKTALERHLADRQVIDESYTGKDRLNKLYDRLKEQHREFGNILTQVQFRRYKEIQPELQPLDKVEE